MLRSIRQGIFSIVDAEGALHNQPSDFLEEIFSPSVLSSRFLHHLLEETNLTDRQKDLILSTIAESIGSPILTWNMYKAKIASECCIGDKILELEWAAVLDKDKNVKIFLVTVRDISEYRDAVEKSNRHTSVISKMSTVMRIPLNQFLILIYESTVKLRENTSILTNHDVDNKVIKTLFFNLQTVKGLINSYGLETLIPKLRSIEQETSQYPQDDAVPIGKLGDMRVQTNRLLRCFKDYDNVSKNQLGHRLLEGMAVLPKSELENLVKNNNKEEAWRSPIKFYYIEGEDLFSEIFGCLPKLAQELEIPTPRLSIDTEGVWYTPEGERILRQSRSRRNLSHNGSRGG